MLGVVDIVLLVLSLILTVAIGLYHSIKGRKADTTEYMLGGRAMSPLPLAMSMTMGTISSVTMMGNIGEMYAYGTQLWMMDVGLAIGMLIVAQVFIPIFFPLKMVSVYQYVEKRFSSRPLRVASVVVTIVGAYLFLGFLLYPPSLFLVQFNGLSQISNIFIMGLTCGIYSAFGGVKAVVHTDVVQSVIMLLGVLTIVIQCTINIGGLSTAWRIASERGRIEFFNMNMSPYQYHSFWLTITFGLFFSLSTYGVTQSQTQRTFCTGSVKQAQRVIYYAIIGMIVLRSLINLAGVAIFAFFADCDPLTAGPAPLPDIFIVIIYVLRELTKIPGLAGLFVASIYAAVLSSVSTQVNSMTALIWEDFLKTSSCFSGWSDVKVTWLQKLIVFLSSVVGIIACLVIVWINSNTFITLLLKITGAMSGPMVGLFLTGLYLPWVRGKPAGFAFLLALIVSFWIAIGQIQYKHRDVLPLFRKCDIVDIPDNSTLEESDWNSTTAFDTTTVMPDFENSTVNDLPNVDEASNFHPIFSLSYCLNYCWGTIITIVFAMIGSCLTGWNTPDTLDENLIAPIAWKVFTKLGSPSYAPPLPKAYRMLQREKSSYATSEKDGKDYIRKDSYRKSEPQNNEELIAMQ